MRSPHSTALEYDDMMVLMSPAFILWAGIDCVLSSKLFLSIFSPQQNTKKLVEFDIYLVVMLHPGLPRPD